MEKAEAAREVYRRQAIWATVMWCLPFLLVGTWIALRKLPPEVACAFHDTWSLRILWPFNLSIYEQLKKMHFATTDACMLMAGNSIFSTYFAILAALSLWTAMKRYRKHGEKVGKAVQQKLVAWKLAVIFAMNLGATWLFSRFHDNVHGKGDFLVYRTYDGPGRLVSKTLVWMPFDYLVFCVLASAALIWLAGPQTNPDGPLLPPAAANSPSTRD